MFRIEPLLDRQALYLRLQRAAIIALALVCLLLWWGWLQAPSRLTIYLPPDIENGATQKVSAIPKPFIYSWAFQVWQNIHYWPKGSPNARGDFPYKQNIERYSAYLTPAFRDELLGEYEQLRSEGRLDRTRNLRSSVGTIYKADCVKRLSANSWEVDLDVIFTERDDTLIVKQASIRYPLHVIRYSTSRAANPYQLAIAGFVRPPERLMEKAASRKQ